MGEEQTIHQIRQAEERIDQNLKSSLFYYDLALESTSKLNIGSSVRIFTNLQHCMMLK